MHQCFHAERLCNFYMPILGSTYLLRPVAGEKEDTDYTGIQVEDIETFSILQPNVKSQTATKTQAAFGEHQHERHPDHAPHRLGAKQRTSRSWSLTMSDDQSILSYQPNWLHGSCARSAPPNFKQFKIARTFVIYAPTGQPLGCLTR